MKVLHITAFSGWGCTGRIAVGIHNILIENEYESIIAWGRKNTADNIENIKIGNKVDQIYHGMYTRLTDKCGFGSKLVTRNFIKKIDKYNPDLIQLHIMHGYYINLEVLFNYLKKKEIPIVWTFHDCWAFTGHCPYFDFVKCDKWKEQCCDCELKKCHPKSFFIDGSSRNYQKKKEIFTGLKNMTIVTPSKWLAELVKGSFLKDYPVVVINNGIDLQQFKPTESDFRKKYCLENKKIILGVSSTWCDSKGIHDFIKLSRIVDDNFKIILVGVSKKQKEILPDTILAFERTDSVKELAEIYTAADVFVNATYEDNYPTTNLEAIACGTPVVTYKTGGSVEIVEETGYGCIVEKGDVHGLAKAVSKIFHDSGIMSNKYDAKYKFLEYKMLYEKILRR